MQTTFTLNAVTPATVDQAKLIFSWAPTIGVADVRDDGHALTFAGDYPSPAALDRAEIGAGHYATCRVGSEDRGRRAAGSDDPCRSPFYHAR